MAASWKASWSWSAVVVSALGLAGGGCDGGGGGGGSSEAGIELPSEISAVSVQGDSGGAYRAGRAARGSVARMLQARTARIQEAVEDLPADADYNTVQVRKFVEIEVLDIFEIIDTIFDAVRQTHYADVENVGSGWYKCMVAFEDEGEGGVTFTQLQEWYVNSTLVGGVNRVRLKILEPDRDGSGEMLILVQADISQAPTENEDGTLADLGVWEIRAVFGEPGAEPAEDEFFHATADITGDGLARLTIEDQFRESIDGDEFLASTRAVVFRSLDEGYGVAEYPNWEACWGPSPEDCSEGPPAVTVLFAYNTNYLSVEVDGDASSFDRTDEHEIVHRYKLYNTTDGSDVERTHTYGFPIRVNEDGDNRFGWYGAWQDRHQVWAHGDSVDDGTSVVRNDGPPGEEPAEYTVRAFSGALTRVQLVEGSLSQVEDIAAEVFLHNDVRLRWDADTDTWFECIGDDGFGGCTSLEDFTDKLPLLAMGGDGDQKQVWINHFEMGESGPSQTQYVYLTSAPGPGFFVAQPNSETGRLESTGVALDTGSLADNWDLFCWVSGRAYIQYTGDFDGPATSTGWVEKTVTDFDFESYTPTFDEDADREFVFELGRSYFISNRGANFRVARTGEAGDATDYDVFMEVHTVAKPTGDLGSVYPDGTVLVDGWNPEQSSTYTLDTDSESANYLLLEYASVSESDEGDGAQVGDVVTKDLWGLRVQGDASDFGEATFYNWTYQEEGDFWGGVSYLVDGAGEFVLVDEPLRFEPIQLASTDDIVNERPESEWLSYSLGFDGHLHGLPDTWWELQKVDFAADHLPAVLAKNVRIPDGTVLTDSSDGTTTYYVKAVDVGIFLGYVTAFPAGEEPDLTPAQAIDLDAELPEFDPPNISPTIPENAELLYIDGVPVE